MGSDDLSAFEERAEKLGKERSGAEKGRLVRCPDTSIRTEPLPPHVPTFFFLFSFLVVLVRALCFFFPSFLFSLNELFFSSLFVTHFDRSATRGVLCPPCTPLSLDDVESTHRHHHASSHHDTRASLPRVTEFEQASDKGQVRTTKSQMAFYRRKKESPHQHVVDPHYFGNDNAVTIALTLARKCQKMPNVFFSPL